MTESKPAETTGTDDTAAADPQAAADGDEFHPTPTNMTPPGKLGEGGERALKAERQARKQAERKLAEVEAKIRSIEDREKTDLERLTDEAARAKAEAAAARTDLLRLQVAADMGLPADLTEFLTGDDEDSLRSKAEKLLAATADTRRHPAPDPSQGAKPGQPGADQLTRADLARMSPDEIEQARLDGRLADLLAGRN